MTGTISPLFGRIGSLALVAILLGACNNAEIQSEKTKLELAKVKNDLDQIFLSLRRLSDLGDNTSKALLANVEKALAARETMLTALGDHDHESALVAADTLIKLVPGHKEATRTLRESGQIFWLLNQAQKSLADVSESIQLDSAQPAQMPAGMSDQQKATWRSQTTSMALSVLGKKFGEIGGVPNEESKKVIKHYVSSYGGGKLTDEVVAKVSQKAAEKLLARIEQANEEKRFAAIANARQFISKARSLDAQFKGSVQLEELLDKAHSAMALSASWRIYLQGSLAVVMAAQMHDSAVKGLQSAASSRYGSVSDFWSQIAPLMKEVRDEFLNEMLAGVSASAKNLASYKGGAALGLVEEAQRFALTASRGVDRLMEPTGSLIDYRRAGVETLDEFKLMDLKFKAALPQKSASDEFAKTAKTVLEFNLYKQPETKAIIDQNVRLYDL